MVASIETVTMLMYSARKNSANFSEEYSVWNPPTSSPSASGRSNGARLVSPIIDDHVDGERREQDDREPQVLLRSTIPDVDIEPAYRNTATSDSPIATS